MRQPYIVQSSFDATPNALNFQLSLGQKPTAGNWLVIVAGGKNGNVLAGTGLNGFTNLVNNGAYQAAVLFQSYWCWYKISDGTEQNFQFTQTIGDFIAFGILEITPPTVAPIKAYNNGAASVAACPFSAWIANVKPQLEIHIIATGSWNYPILSGPNNWRLASQLSFQSNPAHSCTFLVGFTSDAIVNAPQFTGGAAECGDAVIQILGDDTSIVIVPLGCEQQKFSLPEMGAIEKFEEFE